MEKLLTDHGRLKARLDRLEARRKSQSLDMEGLEALVEACFRLGIHPQSDPGEAVPLLLQAHRLDGANPKYAYHLARIFYNGADFDRASKWLETAIVLCPTSHRLWAHVSLLQRDLNAQYRGLHEYEPDDLKTNATRIANAIREGQDSFSAADLRFKPRRSLAAIEADARRNGRKGPSFRDRPHRAYLKDRLANQPDKFASAHRMIDSGHCRWSGVFDLTAEEMLEAQPSNRTLEQLLPLLTYAARMAHGRKGGVSAFVILGVEMLVCGYPVEPVQFLRRSLPARLSLPSLTLLDHVCDLFQATPETVPDLLAESLSQKRIPLMLAALIHHRRVLAPRFLELRVSSKYKRGRTLLGLARGSAPVDDEQKEQQKKEAANLSSAIRLAGKAFAPKPVKKPQASAAYDAVAMPVDKVLAGYKRLAEKSKTLMRVHKGLRQTVVGLNKSDHLSPSQVLAELMAADEIRRKLATLTEKFGHMLDTVLSASFDLDQKDLPGNFSAATQSCRDAINAILYGPDLSRTIQARQAALGPGVTPAILPPEAPLSEMIDRLENFFIDGVDSHLDLKAEFEALESTAKTLHADKSRALILLKKTLVPQAKAADTPDLLKQAQADKEAIEALVKAFSKASHTGARQLDEIVKAVAATKNVDLIPVFDKRLENCRQQTRDLGVLGNFKKMVSGMTKQLAAAKAPAGGTAKTELNELLTRALQAYQEKVFAPPADASNEATAAPMAPLENELNRLPKTIEANAPKPNQIESTPRQKTQRPDETMAALEYDLDAFKKLVDDHFAETAALFDPFGNLRSLPDLEDLYGSLLNHQARILAGLGHRRQARKLWHRLSVQDRLNTAALKNVAICDTFTEDVGRALAAWRTYIETLHFIAIARGNPVPGALERAEFHHQFGGASHLRT